jgi:hypothetical protein
VAAVPVVVDACSALNLFATGRAIEILRAADLQLIVLPEVAGETQYLLGDDDLDDDGEPRHLPIDWSSVLSSGLASQRSLPDEALPGFVELAAHLTDNDARCAAMARHLGCALLSDDGKVRRTFTAKCPSLTLLSIVSVVRMAAEKLGLSRRELGQLFHHMRRRARFEPARRDPAFDWYLKQVT